MSSVPKQLTNIDFIVSAGWLPQKCSVCDTTVEFAWEGDPLFCQRCDAWAPEDIRIRLLRVQDVRSLLGFGEDDAGTSVRRALHTLESDPPPVIGHPVKDVQLPFMDRPLVPGSAYEMYCVHGLSRWASDDLNNTTTLKSTALRYEATPAPVWAIAHHNRTMDGIAKQCASAGEESLHFEPPQSEVLVLLGLVVIPDSEAYVRHLPGWLPGAPWSGYHENARRSQHLSGAEFLELGKAARQFTDFRNPTGKPKGKNKRPRNWYLDKINEHTNALRRAPTEQEFCTRFDVPQKSLRRNLQLYGLWPWEEFLKRGLGCSQSRTIKV